MINLRKPSVFEPLAIKFTFIKNNILCKEIMFLCYSVSQRKKNMYLCKKTK